MRLYPLLNVAGRVTTKSGFHGGRERESRSVNGFCGRPKTFNNGQCGSLGGKMRARLRRYDEDATGAVDFWLASGVCRATMERGTRPKPDKGHSNRGRIAPSPQITPKASADKKAWGLVPQTPMSLAPDHRGGGATVGSGLEEKGRGPPDDGALGRGPQSDAADCGTAP